MLKGFDWLFSLTIVSPEAYAAGLTSPFHPLSLSFSVVLRLVSDPARGRREAYHIEEENERTRPATSGG